MSAEGARKPAKFEKLLLEALSLADFGLGLGLGLSSVWGSRRRWRGAPRRLDPHTESLSLSLSLSQNQLN